MENWWSFLFFHGAVQSHSQASTTLAKSTLKSQNRRRTTLPEDFNYDPQNLRQLFLKPHVKVRIPRRIPGNHSSPHQTSPHQTLKMFWAFPRAALTTNTPGRGKKRDEGPRLSLFPGIFWNVFPQINPSSDPVGALDSEDGIEGYDYNNPNDTLNFCPAPPVQPGTGGFLLG